MNSANITDVKSHLSTFISLAQKGERTEICKRNKPVAMLVPVVARSSPNRTTLGCGVGTGQIIGDVVEPAFPAESWDMLEP